MVSLILGEACADQLPLGVLRQKGHFLAKLIMKNCKKTCPADDVFIIHARASSFHYRALNSIASEFFCIKTLFQQRCDRPPWVMYHLFQQNLARHFAF
ncbi:hypothetical protein C0081_04915 [Cohaesibacter celericrescens]|uniref:Uncharacterized protein n=1 Tax=Cohaesibacter celericrescens TaxID=2067669 RepID=A0A2N5XVG0_9HYPH|nr:hypothetical protein C0081_04915 [Cohaesibacter celericrescens]